MFVLPTHAEGLASVMIEAIVAGCPIITTRRAGVAIQDSVDGVIVAPGDVDALAAAIEKVHCDRAFRDALAANARKLADNYTMEAWKNRLIGVLELLRPSLSPRPAAVTPPLASPQPVPMGQS